MLLVEVLLMMSIVLSCVLSLDSWACALWFLRSYGESISWVEAGDRGFWKIKIHSDSSLALKLLTQGCCYSLPCYQLVKNIHDIHGFEASIQWIHVFREANQVADILMKHELSLSASHVFEFPPSFLCNSLNVDYSCIVFPRGF